MCYNVDGVWTGPDLAIDFQYFIERTNILYWDARFTFPRRLVCCESFSRDQTHVLSRFMKGSGNDI